MSARDELAALIESAIFGTAHEPHAVSSGLRGADAVIAAGWIKPCNHDWQRIPYGGLQVQDCSRCNATRAHSCTYDCDQHEPPTEAQIREARVLLAPLRRTTNCLSQWD